MLWAGVEADAILSALDSRFSAVRVRAERAAEVPVRREGAHHLFGVAGGQPVLVAADDITGMGGPGPEYGRPDVTPLVDWPLAAVGAEHHRRVVGGFGDDCHRPCQFPPVVVQMCQQFHHGPPADHGAGDGLGAGVQPGQPGQVATDEPPQLPVAADLAGAGIVDHYLTRPHRLENVSITLVQRSEVLPDRIGPTGRASLLARQFYGAGELIPAAEGFVVFIGSLPAVRGRAAA